jgi:hypothetical protein
MSTSQRLCVFTVTLLLILGLVGRAQPPRGNQAQLTERGDVPDYGITIRYPTGWSFVQQGNSARLTSVSTDRMAATTAQTLTQSAQVFISIDKMANHAAAQRKLEDIRGESTAPTTVLTIGGWPAIQRRLVEAREQPGDAGEDDDEREEAQPQAATPQSAEQEKARALPSQKPLLTPLTVLRITTAIAADDLIVRIEARLPPNAPADMEATVAGISQSLTFRRAGDAAAVARDLARLRATPARKPVAPPRPRVGFLQPAGPRVHASAARRAKITGATPGSLQLAGLAQLATTGSEAEIAVSTNGQNIVIAQGFGFVSSQNGGLTFSARQGIAVSTGGDASVAFGRSGAFYEATISSLAGATAGSTAVSVSTDNGANFTFRANAFTCPASTATNPCGFASNAGVPFPDQEHIAADRFNASAGGGDQVYVAFRNGNGQYGLVCSNDGGQNWGAATIRTGDFPRLTVGQDGTVYVVYRSGNNITLDSFGSCTSGMALAVNATPVATLGPSNWAGGTTPCAPGAIAGLDRCNNGNNLSSFMVAVDDTAPTHIYVAYAQNTSATNENVLVQDSTDSGNTFPAARIVTVNGAAIGRRYMPWVCAVNGIAYVNWFDRRAASAANDSLTDFFGSTALRDGAGNLVPGLERQINPANTADAQCEAGVAAGNQNSWPFGTRANPDSETCTNQPQLAGRCFRPGTSPPVGSGNACDFSSPNCPTLPVAETCQNASGAPKYGDYNGNACAAGRLYSIWPSATNPPPTIGPAGQVNLFFAPLVVAAGQLQVPGPIRFPDTCVGSSALATANVCNTGTNPLHIDPITSSDPEFVVLTPSSGYAVTVAAGACFPFEVRFTPSSAGNKSAILTIPSDDSVTPSVTMPVSGNGTTAAITTMIADSGDFGTVTPGALRDQPLVITNPGGCLLTVTDITSSAPDFLMAQVVSFPFTVAPGTSVNVPVRFQPIGAGPKSANLTISTDVTGGPRVVHVSGTGGAPIITTSVIDSGDFGEVCVGATKDLDVTLTNSGVAPLVVTAITSSNPEFLLPQVQVFPLVIAPGTSLAIPIRLAPTTPGPKTVTLTFTSNDPVTPAKNVTLTGTTSVAELCHPPSFTALGMSLGPTFGSSKTGDFTFTGQGRHIVPFGEHHNYAFQGQGEYLYYEGRHEGEIDLGLMNRWHHVQLGVFSNFKFADFGVTADGGAVGQASGVIDLLFSVVRVNLFATKGFKDTGDLSGTTSFTFAAAPGPGTTILGATTGPVVRVADAFGGGALVALGPNTDLDGHLMWLRRARPTPLSDKAGADIRVTQHLSSQFALFGELTLNETLLGNTNSGRVVFGFVFGRWTRPSDFTNKRTPLATDVPRLHYDLRTQ